MNKWYLLGLFTAMLATPTTAKALRIAMPAHTTAQKAVMADTVVVGKVTSIEADTVELETYPGSKEKSAFKIAVIKIETPVIGGKNLTHVKVAFAPSPIGGEKPNTGIRPIRPGMGPVGVTEGQEGIFFLVPHSPGSTIMRIPAGFEPVPASVEKYKDELAKVTAVAATVADPIKALKTEKLEDRQAAVSILGQKYRRGSLDGVESVEVALPAEETKLILATILEADWAAAERRPQQGFVDYQSTGPGLAGLGRAVRLDAGAERHSEVRSQTGRKLQRPLEEYAGCVGQDRRREIGTEEARAEEIATRLAATRNGAISSAPFRVAAKQYK